MLGQNTSCIQKKYLKPNIKFKPKIRNEIRKEIRNIITSVFNGMEDIVLAKYPVDIELIGSLLSIKFEEKDLGEDISAELRPDDSGKYKYLALINNVKENEHHKRFSQFHESSHVLLNLFDEHGIAHRLPSDYQDYIYTRKEPAEIICDIAASELIFYYPSFNQELKLFTKADHLNIWNFVQNLANKFDASLEATARIFVESISNKAFLLVIKEGYKKDELPQINPDQCKLDLGMQIGPIAKPRILYSIVNQNIDFYIPVNKSFSEDTIVYKTFKTNNNLSGISDLSFYDWKGVSGQYAINVLSQKGRCMCIGIEA